MRFFLILDAGNHNFIIKTSFSTTSTPDRALCSVCFAYQYGITVNVSESTCDPGHFANNSLQLDDEWQPQIIFASAQLSSLFVDL